MKNKFQKLIEEYGALRLLGSDGSCPCAHGQIFGITIDTHCWRSGMCCQYSGVHIEQELDMDLTNKELREIGELFADYIREAYHTDCAVKIGVSKEADTNSTDMTL